MRVGFITSQNPSECSGGQSSISFSIFKELEKYFECKRLYLPLPKEIWWECYYSKVRRALGFQGALTCFSNRRLTQISDAAQRVISSCNVDFFFFNSMTQWIRVVAPKPYFVYNDICFSTYKEIYFDKKKYTYN